MHLAQVPLKTLNLTGSCVTDQHLAHLVHLNLYELDLSGCLHISETGLKSVAQLKQLKRLKLDRNCHPTVKSTVNQGLIHLKSTTLEELDLNSCPSIMME